MPSINITESEYKRVATFTITDNIVAIPLFVNDSALAKKIKFNLYSDKETFVKDFPVDKITGYLVAPGEGAPDPSYHMIIQLINYGLKVVVRSIEHADFNELDVGETSTLLKMEKELVKQIKEDGIYNDLKSRYFYNIKFITTGAHPNYHVGQAVDGSGTTMVSCESELIAIAAKRGDAIALIEVADIDEDHILSNLPVAAATNTYGAMFYPRGVYEVNGQELEMPAAYGYLTTYASSVRTNPNWYAAAGVTRGAVAGLKYTLHPVSEALIDAFQNGTDPNTGVNVNPIAQVGDYGLKLWGNRTMYKEASTSLNQMSYFCFLNVRLLVCDIKKQIFSASARVTFEPNDAITWINFKLLNNTLLDSMKTNRGLEWYSWTKLKSDQRATINAQLTIKPIEAVEYFNINIHLTDEDVTTAEAEV